MMRSNNDSIQMNMDHLLETMVSLAHKEKDIGIIDEVKRITA